MPPQVVITGGQRAGKVAALAEQDGKNFAAWKDSPAGLSAMGFGRVNSRGGREALEEMKRDLERDAAAKRRA